MKTNFVTSIAVIALAALPACSDTQEVEVTGEATAPATVTSPITIEFFDVIDDAEAPAALAQVKLDKPGPFSQKLEIEGTEVRVFALADADGNGSCSEGDAWAEKLAPVADDGTVEPVKLDLLVQACPAPAK